MTPSKYGENDDICGDCPEINVFSKVELTISKKYVIGILDPMCETIYRS